MREASRCGELEQRDGLCLLPRGDEPGRGQQQAAWAGARRQHSAGVFGGWALTVVPHTLSRASLQTTPARVSPYQLIMWKHPGRFLS